MKFLSLLLWISLYYAPLIAQPQKHLEDQRKEIRTLIDQYARARENQDTVVLKTLLTDDIDQLVSSGEWRRGREESLAGMLRSSTRNPGKRALTVETIRFISPGSALVDARYEIRSFDNTGSLRKMWSTFLIVHKQEGWKIAAIRNMRPAR